MGKKRTDAERFRYIVDEGNVNLLDYRNYGAGFNDDTLRGKMIRKAIDIKMDEDDEDIVTIVAAEISTNKFPMKIKESNIDRIAKDIFEHPSKYHDVTDNSDGAYYNFLKYLWVIDPEGNKSRLMDYIM